MDLTRIRTRMPLVVGLMCVVLAFGRPAQRGAWIAIALVFLIVGLRRRKSATPPGGSPGV